MPKSKYDRYSLTHNLLRKVILRIDFSGLTNITPIIEDFKGHELAKLFGAYRVAIHRNLTVEMDKVDISTDTLPVSEIVNEPIHLFYDYQPSEDIVELHMTTNYIAMKIECREYKNIDPYKDLLIKMITKILAYDTFTQIKRIGIRKIAGYESESKEKVFKIFEPHLFSNDIQLPKGLNIYNEYIDKYVFGSEFCPLCIVYKRLLRKIKNPRLTRPQHQAILDIDGFVNEQALRTSNVSSSIDMIIGIIDELNNYMFLYFRHSVTLQYLHNHGKI